MAGRVIRFLPRQVVAGTGGTAVPIYSPIFEVVGIDTIVVETQVYTASGTTMAFTVDIQETSDPTFADGSWNSLGTCSVASPPGQNKATLPNPLRFVRAKITASVDDTFTASVEAVGTGPS